MTRSLLLSGFVCAAAAFAQGTSATSSTSQTASSGSSQFKARGPEAVAKQEPNKVVAVINGKQVTAREAANLLKAIPPDQMKQLESKLPSVIEQIYMSQDLAQQAVKMNLDQQSPVKEQLALNRDNILARAYIDKMATSSSGGAAGDPQQYYNAHPAEFEKADLSAIWVTFNPPGTPASGSATSRSEDAARAKADDLEKKLKAGSDFSTLARTDSENPQSAAKGGEMGPFSSSQLPPNLRTAVDKLQPGQTSEPVRVPNAFLILKVNSRNKTSFDQARADIVKKLQDERSQAAVKQEVDKYKIDVKDPDFFNSSTGGSAAIPTLQRPGSPPLPTSVSSPSKP